MLFRRCFLESGLIFWSSEVWFEFFFRGNSFLCSSALIPQHSPMHTVYFTKTKQPTSSWSGAVQLQAKGCLLEPEPRGHRGRERHRGFLLCLKQPCNRLCSPVLSLAGYKSKVKRSREQPSLYTQGVLICHWGDTENSPTEASGSLTYGSSARGTSEQLFFGGSAPSNDIWNWKC